MIKLIATYSKRLGLPGYSSHQFSVSTEAELLATDEISGEAARMYALLQESVDAELQATGFVPGIEYGMEDGAPASASNVAHMPQSSFNGGRWACTVKQRDLLLKLVEEHQLQKQDIEAHCRELFSLSVVQLNKVQMSHLIDVVMQQHCGIRPTVPSLPHRGSQGGAR